MVKELRLLSWNVNGIRSAAKRGFINYLHSENPDILAIQETKARPEQLDQELINPRGYHTYWNYPSEKKGYSGVAIITKETPLKITPGIGVEEFDNEGRILVAQYQRFSLLNIYFPKGDVRPPREHRLTYKLAFYDASLKFIDLLKVKNKNIIICGDFNTAHQEIDIARPKENQKTSGFLPEERAWIDELIAHGFVDTFRQFHKDTVQYTWWDVKTRAKERNIGWRLDYFFVTREFNKYITGAFILDNVKKIIGDDASDHCPVGINLKLD